MYAYDAIKIVVSKDDQGVTTREDIFLEKTQYDVNTGLSAGVIQTVIKPDKLVGKKAQLQNEISVIDKILTKINAKDFDKTETIGG